MTKKEIMSNEVNDEELENVSGGYGCELLFVRRWDTDDSKCSLSTYRNFYRADGSYPDCAATVEDGSHCNENDACYSEAAVKYLGLKDCSKAWR